MTDIAAVLAVALLSLTVVVDLRTKDSTCGIRAVMARPGVARSVTLWAVVPDTGNAGQATGDAAVAVRIGTAVRQSSAAGDIRGRGVLTTRTCQLPRRGGKGGYVQRSVIGVRRATVPSCAGDLGRAVDRRRSCARTLRYGPR